MASGSPPSEQLAWLLLVISLIGAIAHLAAVVLHIWEMWHH